MMVLITLQGLGSLSIFSCKFHICCVKCLEHNNLIFTEFNARSCNWEDYSRTWLTVSGSTILVWASTWSNLTMRLSLDHSTDLPLIFHLQILLHHESIVKLYMKHFMVHPIFALCRVTPFKASGTLSLLGPTIIRSSSEHIMSSHLCLDIWIRIVCSSLYPNDYWESGSFISHKRIDHFSEEVWATLCSFLLLFASLYTFFCWADH